MRSWATILFITLCLFMFPQAGRTSDKLSVFVSIEPQRYFVQQIGKELVTVQVMVSPGASPATYEPKARQMVLLSQAQIYFAVGVPFEKAWLNKIAAANPRMVVVRTDQGIEKLAMENHHHHEKEMITAHRHEKKENAHDKTPPTHGESDPHIWLSPPLVKVQARAILSALQEMDPAHTNEYAANCRQFLAEIEALNTGLKETLRGKEGLRFMVFHPSWGYFAKAYGLRQIPIEIEGKAPKPAQLKALIEHAREENIRVIFVQPQFSTKSAALIAKAIGGQVAFADPLASDWMANLLEVANKFKAALR